MKKKFIPFLALAFCFAVVLSSFTACTPRSEILKIFMPGEYIDAEIYDGFSEYYKEKTGKNIEVKEINFEELEEIMPSVQMDKADFDLICPSDYMLQYMLSHDMIMPLDSERFDIEDFIHPNYVNIIKESGLYGYVIPYMYGTMGIMYDYSKLGVHLDSWDAVMTSKYSGKVYLKDSVKDTYAAVCIYNEREELSRLSNGFTDYGEDYRAKLNSVFADCSYNTIERARATLKAQARHLLKWDVEDGKFDMASGDSEAVAGLFWSCDAGYVMGYYEDDDGYERVGNKNLWYTIPKEGGNVYIDSFCISKYAAHVDAAEYFLEYICRPEVAMQNSFYAGAISPVKEAYAELHDYYVKDEDGFFDDGTEDWTDEMREEWKNMYIDLMFPSKETLSRCASMVDFGDRQNAVLEMFVDITNG